MTPVKFKGQNKVLAAPKGMTEEQCGSLPIWSGGGQCISCWQPTDEERKTIAEGGFIFLSVLSNGTQPPVGFFVEPVNELILQDA